ncbi:MAG: HAMP domain-containing protein [Betaproteobacteria bacterium]|nr:HAMP domain-containing protein [Betaproteobacteria bacterium]
MKWLARFRGLSSRIYVAFLLAAGIPVTVAGLVGIYSSLETLRQETLHHLEQEVRGRAAGMGHFFDQLATELLYLASSSLLQDLADSLPWEDGGFPSQARERLERDYTAFARAYPYIYQVRFLDAAGRERARVDRRRGKPYVVPEAELQDKSDRYYVHEGLAHAPGQVYVSPLDLNVERGQVEVPERPVIRFATPIAGRGGEKRGLLIVNLHAAYILEQIQQMAGGRGGVSYLFDRSGFYLSRSVEAKEDESAGMRSVETLATFLPRPLLSRVVGGQQGTEVAGDWIVAYAPIAIGETLADRSDSSMGWSVALAFPKQRLFEAVFNLYLLYGVLALSLLVTALGGLWLSRRLLRPLTLLAEETEEIALGHFAHRVEIRGNDEIADLGRRFNAMAARLDELVARLAAHRDRLEDEVRARTRELEREQEERRELDRQVFQMEKMATLGEIAMGLAHEIGNPLAGIKAVVQMLLEEDLSGRQREYLMRVEGEIDRLSRFLRTFHGFAAPQEMHPVACRLDQVLDDVLLWTRREAKTRGVAVRYAPCCGETPELWADPGQLKQLLLNLVINAIHAMPRGGEIRVGHCLAGDGPVEGGPPAPRVRFCVRDSGGGIAPEVQARIFDPFYTTRADGSGLGLAVVKKIATQHGAEIFVDSTPGHGTCLELVWPVAPAATQGAPQHA